MELQLWQRSLEFSRRRRKWILLAAAFGATGYGVYNLYNLPSVAKKRRKLLKLVGAFVSIAELVSDSTETITVVSNDLKDFLQSDSNRIPTSLKQISKIAKSEEFSDSVARVTQAVVVGVLRGYNSEMKNDEGGQAQTGNPGYLDRILDKIVSGAGTGFASVVVGSFARSLVMAVHSCFQSSGDASEQMGVSGLDSVSEWVNVLCNGKCRELIADCIQLFVSTAVAVYLEKTMDINTYDELFSGLTNPKHEMKVRNMLVSVCNGAVETLVKTSHKVLTTSSEDSDSASYTIGSDQNGYSGKVIEYKETYHKFPPAEEHKTKDSFDGDAKESQWLSKVSSTLAVPRNRRFVLDVTGRVTFETVRSFLDYLIWKLLDGIKRSVEEFYNVVADTSLEVMKYIGAKSAVIHTICIALCLHVLDGATILVPA